MLYKNRGALRLDTREWNVYSKQKASHTKPRLYQSLTTATDGKIPHYRITFMNRIGPIDPAKLEELASSFMQNLPQGLADNLPDGIQNVRDELENGFRSTLTKGLDKLDLVTREEFDVQKAVLARTREKLEALEQRLSELED